MFTVATAKEELKVAEARAPADARRIAHAFADAIYQSFTREPGGFQSRIAFVKKSGSNKDVWMADWDGHNAFPVAQGGLNILPGVTADGAGVAFTSYRRGHPELFAQRAGGAAQLLVSAGQMTTGVAYSPDGRQIAYSVANADSSQLWVAGADGSGARQLTDVPYTINTSPSWSPDGKRLAFVSNRGGSPQIYVMGAGGGDARRLTFQGTYNQTPDWAPRADLIAFTARDERTDHVGARVSEVSRTGMPWMSVPSKLPPVR
jgi:TolB protein